MKHRTCRGNRARPSWELAAVLVATWIGGCGPDFQSRSTLSGYRVIGVQATPPEVKSDGAVELSVFDYNDAAEGTEASRYHWSVCLFSIGAGVGFDCADPAAEFDLGTQATARLDLGPNGLDLRAALAALGETPKPDGSPRTLEGGLELLVRLTSGPDCDGCDRIQTVKRVTVRDGDGPANDNPIVDALTAEGDTVVGAKVRLHVEVNPPESYVDPASGAPKTEEYLYSWYASRGEADPALSFGEDRDSELELTQPGPLRVFVAVRDPRGGLTVASLDLEVTAP